MRDLFARAMELPPERRRAFVERECGTPSELFDEVQRLLEHENRMGGFLLPFRPLGHSGDQRPSALLLAAGERLGDYEVEGFVAAGGGGQVYRARQLSLGGRSVALKVVDCAVLGASERERFLRGAETAARLHHPGLVQVYASGEDTTRRLLYYSMRLVEGPSLEVVLTRLAGRAPRATVRRALVERAREIAEALGELHRNGLVHRDVKPANVLVEGGTAAEPWAGRAILVDYGLLRSRATDARSTALGTLPYAAPELFLQGHVDERADVYGLGLCLYDLVSGSRERGGAAQLERLARRVPGVEPELEAIVERAIEPAPSHRYRDGAALAAELSAFLEGGPVRTPRLAGLALLGRALRRSPEGVLRWSARAILGAAALALVGLAWWGVGAHARAAQVGAAWRAGDLETLAHDAGELGWAERRLMLDAPVTAALAEIASPSALGAVTSELRARGVAAACELATRHLSRDGLVSHPDLLRFLGHGIRSPYRADALRWSAVLVHELPAETAEGLACARPVVDAVSYELERGTLSPPERLYALSILGTCGDARAIPILVDACEQAARIQDAEGVRLSLRALQFLAYRCRGAGFAAEFGAAGWGAILEGLRGCAARTTLFGNDLVVEYGDLACVVALRCSQLGLAPLADELVPGSVVFRAANRDPSLIALRGDSTTLFTALLAQVEERDFVPRVGRAMGLLGVTMSAANISHCLSTCARDVNVPLQQEVLAGSILLGLAEREGLPDTWRPDPDTRLGVWLTEVERGWESVRSDVPRYVNLEPEVVAAWAPTADGVWQMGLARGYEQRCAPLTADELPAGFARFGQVGLSEVRLRFAVEGELSGRSLRVRINHQRGLRPALPYEGEATALLRSGADEVRFTTAGRSAETLDVVLSPPVPDERGEAVLTISMEAGTTTFRVYRVELLPAGP